MIGGLMKTTSRLTIATAFAAFASTGAMAADLGGNCCSDLEERVAELEATTARKGNRRVSLEVSGHVHEAVLLWDDGFDDGAYIATSNYSRTRFRFKGSAKINSDWSAGYLIELGLRQTGNTSGANQTTNSGAGVDIRHQALYVKSNRLGTVWLGHTSFAVDGVADICLGCPISSSHEANLGWGGFRLRRAGTGATIQSGQTGSVASGALVVSPTFFTWSNIGAGALTTSNGARDQIIRYISPEMGGFVISADTQLDESANDDPRWSIALRYANEFNGVRIAGGVGYFEEDTRDGWGMSASMQHVATGLFISGTYEEETDTSLTIVGGNDTSENWSIVGGMTRKFSPLGATTFWVRYAEYDGKNIDANNGGVLDSWGETDVISLGINQKIDAAAMEVYVSYYHVESQLNQFNATGLLAAPGTVALEDFDAVLFGARIRF